MSSITSEKTAPTYLINNGSFGSNIIFELNLPKPVGFLYNFSPELYNISKNIGGTRGAVNAICFFIKKSIDNDIPLNTTANTVKKFNFDPSILTNYGTAIAFDSTKSEAFVIVIHNHTFDTNLVEQCFQNLGDYIEDVRLDNSPKIIDLGLVPRRLGVSIITR